ncbi:MAG: hypothetical protein COX80_01385 [Candidatus Magasanikbacteria bacterium CG_4_10_14_0_2_um_filter_33_14]|uniref:PpiC domain-containing protein n=1 Tax=Candidatus Magasanikbacteria bacterium CG_4_10_14_0_2_um_filter_33_14 TaxID=1974636 RepID=A0A2M7VBF3_9BACT|nr:MAG: hypothetical protein COX80_01385 [Candidatus Magasanikbacteria bacterium CG_4_10_14_0_2_um_filter_33_14]
MSEEQKMSPEMEKKDGAMDLPETGTAMASKSTKPVNQRKTSPLVLGLGGFVVALVVGFLIFYGVSVAQVKNMSRSSFTFKSAAFLHLPVASINGKKVLYTDYIDNIQAMEKFYETDSNGDVAPTEDEKSDFILSRLLINNLVADVADDMDVKVTKEDIDKIATEQIVSGFPSKEDAEKEIMDRYGWTLAEFLDKIVYPTELEKKLSEKYAEENPSDNTADEAVRTQALEILKQIQDGTDFVEMAQQYGSDGTATEGGDLGWFGRGMMVPEFEEVAFSLDKGELYSDVVKTQYGYHILQVTDRRTTTDEEGNEVEEVQARHILFPFQENTDDAFRTFMNDKLKNADIKIIADVHNPFEGIFDTETTSTQE